MSIKFKETFYDTAEEAAVCDALKNGTDYLSCAKEKLSKLYGTESIFLTANGSLALDILLFTYDFPKGGEVILPSFTYPSAANSILRMGLIPVFCDIDPQTLVMDIVEAKSKITDKTICVIPTHYGGASCDMAMLKEAFKEIIVIEDAALSLGASYNARPLGTLGNAATVSFHKTKNVSSDEGGAVILNDLSILKKLETIYNNGTDRQSFLRGEVPFYSWWQPGINAVMSNINAAVLCAQLDKADAISKKQNEIFDAYMKALAPLAQRHSFSLPIIPEHNTNNAHIFYIVFSGETQRDKVKEHLEQAGIGGVTHYVPLHQSGMWKKMGKEYVLPKTEHVYKCMLRIPMHARMTKSDCQEIADEIGRAL